MSLVDKLMAIDKGAFAEERTGIYRVKRLSEIIGEPIDIKLRALPGDLYVDITTRMLDKNGNPAFTKTYDVNALLVVEGVAEPNLKDESLQKHFGAASPKELAKKLFQGGELTAVANEITKLSGFSQSDEEIEAEVKN